MEKAVPFILLSFFIGLFASYEAIAEFRCESQISYTVESQPIAVPLTAAASPAQATTPPPVPTASISTVSIAQIEAKGTDEAHAKAALQKISSRYVEKAREMCRDKHENVGGCISAKFEANAAALRSLDFSVRKALEESLRGDCEVQRGRCIKAQMADPVCAEVVVAAASSASPEAEAGKDDKKKGKK